MFSPTSPTTTTRALRRQAWKACARISLLGEAAVMITASAPIAVGQLDDLLDEIAFAGLDPDIHAVLESPISMRLSSTSVPITRQPLARQQLRRDLAEDAEPDHDDGLAQCRTGAAHALHRDGAQRHGRRCVEAESRPEPARPD